MTVNELSNYSRIDNGLLTVPMRAAGIDFDSLTAKGQ